MADEGVLEALMGIFNSACYRLLTVHEITEQIRRKGFYPNVPLYEAESRVNTHLCLDRTSAHYPFKDVETSEGRLWGLETWFPSKPSRGTRKPVPSVEPLPTGWKTQHIMTVEGQELEAGTFPLRQNFDRLLASLDKQQLEQSLVAVRCYGSEQFTCFLNHAYITLESKALQHWYNENGVQPGDSIGLTVEQTKPLVLRIYTEWDRDADRYRRYIQRRQLDSLPRTVLPIRDLIWLYFKQKPTPEIAHRSDIIEAVLADRPEISERSIDACLSANSHLFARTGERGYWGLKEWGIGEHVILNPPKESVFSQPIETTKPVDVDYVLATIHGEDLVYRILKSAKTPLSYSELTERIGRYLGVAESVLKYTSFLNAQDARLVRLHDGTFTLRDDLEEVISKLIAGEKETAARLARAEKERDEARQHELLISEELARAKQEYESQLIEQPGLSQGRLSQIEARVQQLEYERDEARHIVNTWRVRWKERTQRLDRSLSRFVEATDAYFNRPRLKVILDVLRHRKPESPWTEEEGSR
jgi:DNA-directed RNA polymerase delta subunit